MSNLLQQGAEPQKQSKPEPATHCPCGTRKHYYSPLCMTCTKAARRSPIVEDVFIVNGYRCRKISLTHGQYTLVLEEDFWWLSYFYWLAYWCEDIKGYYAVVSIKVNGRWTKRQMSRMILNVRDDDVEVDHADHETLNNVRFNLRPCTKEQNLANRGILATNTSGYIGVKQNKKRGKLLNSWSARIGVDGVRHYLGSFPSPESAARARDAKAIELCGQFAFLNFPNHLSPPLAQG